MDMSTIVNSTLNFNYECNLLKAGLYEIKENQFINSAFSKSVLNKISSLSYNYPIKRPKINNKFNEEEMNIIKDGIVQSLSQKIMLTLYLSLLDTIFKSPKIRKNKKVEITEEDLIFVYYLTTIYTKKMNNNDIKEILEYEKTFKTVNNIYKYINIGLNNKKINEFLEKIFRCSLSYYTITTSKNFLDLGLFDFHEPIIEFYESFAYAYMLSRGESNIYLTDLFNEDDITYKTFDKVKYTYNLLYLFMFEDFIQTEDDPYNLFKSREKSIYVKLIEDYFNSIYHENLLYIKNFIQLRVSEILETIDGEIYNSTSEAFEVINYKNLLSASEIDNKFLLNSALSYFFTFSDLNEFIKKNKKRKNFKSKILDLINEKFILLEKLINLYKKNNYYVDIDKNLKNKIKMMLLKKIKEDIKNIDYVYTDTFQHLWEYILFILSLKIIKNMEIEENNIRCDDINTFVKNSVMYINILSEILPEIKKLYINLIKRNKIHEVVI